jgi:3-dehydroquinate dehydratase-2
LPRISAIWSENRQNWTKTEAFGRIAALVRANTPNSKNLSGMTMAKLLLLNGPNLNLLGTREPEVYGTTTLDQIVADLSERARRRGAELEAFQSNDEGALIDRIQQAAREGVDFILLNPAALTHTSIALRDALLGVAIPFIEIHLSNVFAREGFRHRSYLTDVAAGLIAGLGTIGYTLALEAALERVATQDN